MNNPSTPQADLVVEARELLSKATPSPWRVHSFGDRPEVQGDLANGNGGYPCRQILTMGFAHVEWSMLAPEVQREFAADAALIARAPELLRQLCDEVERLSCYPDEWNSRASVAAPEGDALKKLSSRIGDAISESLRAYRCQHTRELPDLENGLSLIDLLTPEPDKDVTRGVEECDLLADYIWCDVDDAIKEFAAASSSET